MKQWSLINISTAFGKPVSIIKRLISYEDTNLLVVEKESGLKYVFKIFKREELCTKHSKITQQIDVVLHLVKQGFKCSDFLAGKNGSYLQVYEHAGSDGQNTQHLCFLYSFIPGIELENSGCVNEPTVMFELGLLLSQFHCTLEDLLHNDLLPDPEDPWHMSNIGLLARPEYLQHIKEVSKQERLKTIVEGIESTFSVFEGKLKKGILHGDFHGYNLIVENSFSSEARLKKLQSGILKECLWLRDRLNGKNQTWAISSLASVLQQNCRNLNRKELCETYGIIDFGEISYSYLVLEVGRLMADLMCIAVSKPVSGEFTRTEQTQQEDISNELVVIDNKSIAYYVENSFTSPVVKTVNSVKDSLLKHPEEERKSEVFLHDVILIGGIPLCGYLAINPLQDAEISVLKASVMSSLVQYYVLGLQAKDEQPDNSDYVGLGAAEAERLLWQIDTMSQEQLNELWMDAAVSFLRGSKVD